MSSGSLLRPLCLYDQSLERYPSRYSQEVLGKRQKILTLLLAWSSINDALLLGYDKAYTHDDFNAQ